LHAKNNNYFESGDYDDLTGFNWNNRPPVETFILPTRPNA